jgi:flagellar biosynthesis protein FlhG
MLRVISVTSGKGGVGKTHLAANIGTLCARSGLRTLAIDADGGMANLDTVLGLHPARHVGHLLDGMSPDEVLIAAPSGLMLLPGSPGERRLVHLDEGDQRALVSAWDELAPRFDLVVLDCGPGVGDDTLFFAAAGQRIILIVTEEATSLGDGVVLVGALGERTAVREVDVVVNGVRTARSGQSVFSRLAAGAARFPVRLHYLGHVPDDQNVRRAAMLQKPLVELAPTSPASRAFERLVEQLLSAPVAVPAGASVGAFEQLDAAAASRFDEDDRTGQPGVA